MTSFDYENPSLPSINIIPYYIKKVNIIDS
nr:MAG TPA: hypothetical protein [Caudoviricetes sp.]